MKNKICLILPFAGKFHDYIDLFLYSIHKNKSLLDLYILIPDSNTPELETDCSKLNLPENVFIKKVNYKEALQIFESKLSEIFCTKVILDEERFNFIKKPYALCHYRGFFNVWCSDIIKEYTHWGWIDNDLILGNLNELIPNLLDLDVHALMGHFSFVRNEYLPREAYGPVCNFTTPLYNKAYDYFVNKNKIGFAGDETWAIRTITKYVITKQKHVNRVVQRDYLNQIFTPAPSNLHEFNNCYGDHMKAHYFEYENGNIYAVDESNKTPLVYAHFMKRTKHCINNIIISNLNDSVSYKILPVLNFQ